MTITIERHQLDMSYVAERVGTERMLRESSLRNAGRTAANPALVMHRAYAYVGCMAVIDPAGADLPSHVRLMARSGSFALALASGEGEIEVRLDDAHVVRLRAAGPSSVTHVGVWHTAAAAAVIARDVKSLEMLIDVPTSVLRRSSTTGPEYQYLFVDALREFYSGRSSPDALMAALEATDPDNYDLVDVDYALNIAVSEMQLLLRLMTTDRAEFNRDLAVALTRHRDYFGKSEDRSRDPEGFIALGPLAFAAIAHDSGWPIEVESDYLPKRLLRGEHATDPA